MESKSNKVIDNVLLSIKRRVFDVSKDTLCEYSDYFRAMFSGNYVENKLGEIIIDTLEPETMEIILKYMQIGLIDLSEYSLTTIGDIAIAANFLQITELIKQIEYTLDLHISESNWIEIMSIAEQCSYNKLGKVAIIHGLLSFKTMKPDYIPTIHMLAWYLSHPFLDSESESDIFKFGYQWILHHETGVDALSVIIGCLDIERINKMEMEEIRAMMKDYENSLAAKLIDCLHYLINNKIKIKNVEDYKSVICEEFTERVYTEVLNTVKNSTVRKLTYSPVIPIWIIKGTKPEFLPHYLFSFTRNSKFQQWLEVAEKNLWGWSVVSWGPTKIVLVCGEHGRGTGIFMRDVKVYDTLRKEWIQHGVQLPHQRHAGLAIVGDSLFIVGGVGSFRVVLDTAIIYDLKQRTFRKIAKFPDAIQNPAVCSHEDAVYAAGHKNIYRYEDQGGSGRDLWKTVVSTDIRMSCMRSYRKYIYCTQSYFSNLYRFRPGIDEKLESITSFSSPPSTMCNMRDHLVVFTRTISDIISVEEFRGNTKDETPKVIYTETDTMRVNEVAGSCVVILESPPTEWEVSLYVRHYLQRYSN